MTGRLNDDKRRTVFDLLAGSVSLVRPVNAAISFLAIMAAGLIAAPGDVPWLRLSGGAAAGMLVGAGGNIFNDILDVSIDRINRPGRALPSGTVTPVFASVLCLIATVIGLAGSWFLGLGEFLVAAGATVLIFTYSRFLKQIPLAGNVVVGVVTGSAMVFGSLITGSFTAGLVPGAFAFLTNTAREIVKDMEDIAGDSAHGVYTFPARFGMRSSKALVSSLLILVILATPLPYLFGMFGGLYLILVLTGVDTLLIFLTFVWWLMPEPSAVRNMSAGLKVAMILGIIAFLIGKF
jgi:geranylgeranylglycerol-phosphate geranylgeranyltransferase